MTLPFPLRALLLAAAATALPAQEATFGLRGHLLLPVGDLPDLASGQLGLGLAGFVDIPVGRGFSLRPVVGGQFIPKGDSTKLPGTKTRITSVDFMVDAVWFPSENPERGPYLVGSAGAQQWQISSAGTTTSTVTHTRMGLGAGLGYQASPRLGFEIKGVWSPITPDITATGLTFGATMRF
ncbi:hypothetical protein [Geothrix sp. 21YS21S-4]|uniref:hypothetical protein n=1 Tax=Geothrix sp. 21YS21S-4 TaxID=3068889 RepID=UPI0027B91112|nr:hypothetical protein [Geothrix sp. 21YS21S-4]